MKSLAFIGCGGRDYDKESLVWEALDKLATQYDVRLVITGGAKGADTHIDEWATCRRKRRMVVEADWDIHGKMAGHLRNADMLGYLLMVKARNPDWRYGVVAFPGGVGTADMVSQAKAAGVSVRSFR